MRASRMTRAVAALVVVAGCGSSPSSGPLADGSDSAVSAAISAVTDFPTELDPRLWDGTELKPEVRDKTLAIVDRIVRSSDVPGLSVDAVELFGSNASYEYDDASDFGVHVITRSTVLAPEPLGRLLKLVNDEVERRQEGHITFNGVPVEVTFHSDRGENYRPQYSVSERHWIERPVQQPDNFDREQMATDMKRFIGLYNGLVEDFERDKKGFACSRFGDLDASMSDYRNSGFAAGLGSRSTQNLAYRALRRINVSVPDMVDQLEDECTFGQESIG